MNILNLLRATRLRPLIAVFGLVALIGVAMWLAFPLLRPTPQWTVVMAVYPEGSVNAELAKRYQGVLARSGIDMKLAPSAGAVESVAKSAISFALIPGGITTEKDSPELVSLGTLFTNRFGYSPMVHYRQAMNRFGASVYHWPRGQ